MPNMAISKGRINGPKFLGQETIRPDQIVPFYCDVLKCDISGSACIFESYDLSLSQPFWGLLLLKTGSFSIRSSIWKFVERSVIT